MLPTGIFACVPRISPHPTVTRSLRSFLLLAALILSGLSAWSQGADQPVDSAMGDWVRRDQLRIRASQTLGKFLAVNEAKGYEAAVDANGFDFRSSTGTWATRLTVVGLSRYRGYVIPWKATGSCLGSDLRFHGDRMDVQYTHGTEGLRQNFLLAERPEGAGPLQVHLRYSGELSAHRDKDGGLAFADAGGDTKFTYTGLKAWDACGRVLPARFIEDPYCDDALSIHVDDERAVYPIVIDPVSSTATVVLNGTLTAGQFGKAVCTAGDLNGDGYSDVVVGAPVASNGESQEGVVYVYYGSNTGISTVPSLILESNQVNANFGYAVSTAGDVNGDGYSDLLVGAQTWESEVAHDREGGVFVYHGSATGLSTTPAIILQADVTLVYMGSSVSTAGDINNDGYSDVVVGAPWAAFPLSLEGAAYVYLGSASGLSNTVHKRLERNQGASQFGQSVTGAGDVNGDGYSDIAISAFRWDLTALASDEGIVCIYFGSATGLAAGANPAPNQTINAVGYGTYIGWSIACAGDVNGDGYSDLVCGDQRGMLNGGPSNEGTMLIFHGSAAGLAAVPATVVESNQADQLYGRCVSSAGDVNGDGYADVIVGAVTATYGQSLEGCAYLYLGSATGAITPHFIRYEQNIAGSNMGESVHGAGDVNGDGYADMIVGLKSSGTGGQATIYMGGAYNVAATPTATRYSGMAGARMGGAVANAGDINGDGYSDAVIGAPDASNGQAGEGLVYVHYGSTAGLSVAPSATLEANVAGARFGFSVSTAGDVNGDGYADLIIGAPDAGGTGRAYVYMGSAGGIATSPAITISGAVGAELGYSVCTAGDVNSDGFADVVIGAPGILTAYIHWGTPTGTWPSPQSVYTGPAGSRYGAAVSTAGDVNGSGYSSVVVGAPTYSNGQASEGAAYVYHGSNGGTGLVHNTLLEPNLANALFGTSVAGVGDVNGNGFYDLAIGAPGWASGQAGEGATFVYYGTGAGITAVGMQTVQPNVVGAQLGYDVNEAGDVNGDGYADIVIGVPQLTNGQANEGRLYIVEGAAAGIGTTTQVESNVVGARMGWSVAGGGDVNGDGYSDIIGGGPDAAPSFANEGGFFLFNGNQGRSLDRRTRQYLTDLVSPLSTNSLDFSNLLYFGIGHRARSPIQRERGRLRWEVVFEGQPFTGGPITNSLGFTAMSPGWTNLGLAGTEIKQLVQKTPSHIRYKWRVRVEYPLNKLIDGQRFSRWFYGYAPGLGDIGILPVELLDFRGEALAEGNRLLWSTGSETGSDRFVVERGSDGTRFEPVGMVQASGNSEQPTEYTLLDRNAPAGLSYYRLRMVDRDASEDLSEVIAVMRSSGGPLTVFPNPASELITWTRSENVSVVRVLDALGKTLISRRQENGQPPVTSVAELPEGAYTLELLDAQGTSIARGRFIKAQAPIAP